MIYRKDAIDMSLVQCPYEEEQGYIYISDEYTINILKLSGYNDIDEYDFQTLCRYKLLEPYLYEYAFKSTTNAYYYSRVVLGGRFEIVEPIIATSAECSYRYARDVLKGKFELSESAIASSAEYSYLYAREVLKGRFELGESVIASSAEFSHYYAFDALKGRFELGESVIVSSAECSYMYASCVVKGRFELGEIAISSDTHFKNKYKQLTGIEL